MYPMSREQVLAKCQNAATRERELIARWVERECSYKIGASLAKAIAKAIRETSSYEVSL